MKKRSPFDLVFGLTFIWYSCTMSSLVGIATSIALALLSIAPFIEAVPSPHSIRSDLAILLHNDPYCI